VPNIPSFSPSEGEKVAAGREKVFPRLIGRANLGIGPDEKVRGKRIMQRGESIVNFANDMD